MRCGRRHCVCAICDLCCAVCCGPMSIHLAGCLNGARASRSSDQSDMRRGNQERALARDGPHRSDLCVDESFFYVLVIHANISRWATVSFTLNEYKGV